MKVVCEAVALICSPELSWNLLPLLEDLLPDRSIVQIVCAALADYIKALSLEDAAMPVLLRSCEKLGRLLLGRPHFGDHLFHPSHRSFSPKRIEKDGEAIIPLWLALRRHYRLSNTPKERFVGLPLAVKMIGKFQGMDLSAIETRTNWAFDHLSMENPSRVSQSISSPVSYQNLLKACIWLAPDPRYCPKEHEELWTGFALNLVSSFEALANYHFSCEYLLGDVSELLTELLRVFFERVKLSSLLSFLPDAMRTSSPSPRPSVSLLDNILETASQETRKKRIVPISFNLRYLSLLTDLSSLAVRHALTQRLALVLPEIWQFLLLLLRETEDWTVLLSLSQMLFSHFFAVLSLAGGANRLQNTLRAEVGTAISLFSLSLCSFLPSFLFFLLRRCLRVLKRPLCPI